MKPKQPAALVLAMLFSCAIGVVRYGGLTTRIAAPKGESHEFTGNGNMNP